VIDAPAPSSNISSHWAFPPIAISTVSFGKEKALLRAEQRSLLAAKSPRPLRPRPVNSVKPLSSV